MSSSSWGVFWGMVGASFITDSATSSTLYERPQYCLLCSIEEENRGSVKCMLEGERGGAACLQRVAPPTVSPPCVPRASHFSQAGYPPNHFLPSNNNNNNNNVNPDDKRNDTVVAG